MSACAGWTFTMTKDTNTAMVSFNPAGPKKENVKTDVYNDVLAVSGETQSTSEPVKKDMNSASGNMVSLGGRGSLPQVIKVGSDFAGLRQKRNF
jgi:hypothetical protein